MIRPSSPSRTTALVLILAVLSIGCARRPSCNSEWRGPRGDATVSGTVTDGEGGVWGAAVCVWSESTGGRSTVADKDGRFAITGLVAGCYSVHVELLGFTSVDGTVDVRPSEVTEYNPVLALDPKFSGRTPEPGDPDAPRA